MSSLSIFRLGLSDPLTLNEQLGDPVTNQGGAPVPAVRAALRHAVSLSTITGAPAESVEERMRKRRQLRSLLNNTPFKLQGFYVQWESDAENSGWYLPDQGQLTDLGGNVGIGTATGLWEVENFVWLKAGSRRTHRRAMAVSLKDLRTGLWPRDHRRAIFSTDFSGLSTLALAYFPPGASDLLSTGALTRTSTIVQPVAADASQGQIVEGPVDLARISYEQPEASRNLGQVVVYDRRGELTGPTGGAGPAWEEVYGPDYQWSWLEGGAIDAPVIENGRCRVRFDSTHTPGFVIDVWTGTAWEEQGKINPGRGFGDVPDNELLSASVLEYGETRAVIQAIMRNNEPGSREEVIITLQRGWSGPKVEVYAAPLSNGTQTSACVTWTLPLADSDDSIFKIDAGNAGKIEATAKGTGHTGHFGSGVNLGAATFTGDNYVSIARWKGTTEALPFAAHIAMLQAAVEAEPNTGTGAYGAQRNLINLYGPAVGWIGVQFGFSTLKAQQAMEAENMTLATGTTSTADAEGSNGKTATATRVAEALHVSKTLWPNGDEAVYRVFVKVKTSVATSKLKVRAKTAVTTGAIVESVATALGWIDLGSIASVGGTLEIFAWLSAAGTLSVDRVETFLIEDREVGGGGIFEGARDLGQRSLDDCRLTPTIVTRSV